MERFCLEAEESLDLVVKKSPDNQAQDKAQNLQKLALIPGSLLNKAGQAKQDILQAIALQPVPLTGDAHPLRRLFGLRATTRLDPAGRVLVLGATGSRWLGEGDEPDER